MTKNYTLNMESYEMGGPKKWVDFIFEKLKSLGEGGGGGRFLNN